MGVNFTDTTMRVVCKVLAFNEEAFSGESNEAKFFERTRPACDDETQTTKRNVEPNAWGTLAPEMAADCVVHDHDWARVAKSFFTAILH